MDPRHHFDGHMSLIHDFRLMWTYLKKANINVSMEHYSILALTFYFFNFIDEKIIYFLYILCCILMLFLNSTFNTLN